MTIALAWKEWRDHRAIWFTLALAIVGGLALFVALVDPPGHVRLNTDKAILVFGLAYILAVTYGLVCGSMMIAGEVEAGTQAYLDAHAGSRGEIWRGKFIGGMLLTLAQGLVAVLTLTVIMEPVTQDTGAFLVLSIGLSLAALEAFCWGMFFSARQETVLGAAAMTAVVLMIIWGLSLTLLSQETMAGLFLRPPLALAVLYGSRRRYCKDDARASGEEASTISPTRALLWLAWRQGKGTIGWVVACSVLVGAALAFHLPGWPLLLLALSVLCGVQVFADEQTSKAQRFLAVQRLPAAKVWRVKTGFWGGITALVSGLPYLTAYLIDALQLGPSPNSSAAARLQVGDNLLAHLGDEAMRELVGPGLFAVLVPLYGFSVAQYLGLFVRKPIGTVVVSYLLAAKVLAFWLPSLVCGGVELWQVLLPPGLLLTGSRLAVWPWLVDQLGQPRALLRFWIPGVAALATVAGSLAWRVEEVKPTSVNLRAFESRLLSPEKNEAGRLYRKAGDEFLARLEQVQTEIAPPPMPSMPMGMPGAGGEAGGPGGLPAAVPMGMGTSPAAGGAPGAGGLLAPVLPPQGGAEGAGGAPAAPLPGLPAPAGAPPGAVGGLGAAGPGDAAVGGPGEDAAMGGGMGSFATPASSWLEVMIDVQREGWPKDPGNLSKVLDQLYAGDWSKTLREATALPDGMIEDPRQLSWFSPLPELQAFRALTTAQCVRAMQLQAAGDHAGALERILELLPLSRALGHGSIGVSYLAGLAIEAAALGRLEQWLTRAKDQPKLLRRALQALREHATRKPPFTDQVMAEYLILQRTFDDPRYYYLSSAAFWSNQALPRNMAEILFAARQVPWEKERWERLVRAWAARQLDTAEHLQHSLPPPPHLPAAFWQDAFTRYYFGWPPSPSTDLVSLMLQSIARSNKDVRDLELKAATELYRLEKKHPPKRIRDLVPEYLPESFLQVSEPEAITPEDEAAP